MGLLGLFKKKNEREANSEYHFPVISGADEYLWEVVLFVVREQKCSTGMLQRNFKISFSRAQKIIQQLELIGIIETDNANCPRSVLVDEKGLDGILQNLDLTDFNEKQDQGKEEQNEAKSINNTPSFQKNVDAMSGYDFEEYCIKVLANAGFYNIQHTKLSGDFGIDIIAERNGMKIGIQCKRYSSPVGVKAVQEAISGSVYYGCSVPMVLSNQDYTPQAIRMAHRTNALLMRIEDLIKVSQNKEQLAYKVLMPSEDDVRALAKNIFKSFSKNGVYLSFENMKLGNNETVYFCKKEDRVKINKILSLKSDIMFAIGKNFEIKIDYENQQFLFIFSNRDVVGYSKRNNE